MTKPIFPEAEKRMMKPSRRGFLKCGMGACSAAALIHSTSAQKPVVPYYKAVFDERFEDARAFAIEATARNIPAAAIRGDVTSLFFNDLDLRWKQGPVWLTGLTTPSSLFCLDLLARDRGMRLHYYRAKPRIEAVLDVLDGALPRRSRMTHLPACAPSDLVFWILAPNARGSAQETANA
jgi:hypothetical protein